MSRIIPKPMIVMRNIESGTEREKPKRMSPAPNIPEEIAIILPRPITVRRKARLMALVSAPTPEAPIRKPKVCASPWRTFPAMIGASTVYGVPTIDQTE